jgi:hypothetical protein
VLSMNCAKNVQNRKLKCYTNKGVKRCGNYLALQPFGFLCCRSGVPLSHQLIKQRFVAHQQVHHITWQIVSPQRPSEAFVCFIWFSSWPRGRPTCAGLCRRQSMFPLSSAVALVGSPKPQPCTKIIVVAIIDDTGRILLVRA